MAWAAVPVTRRMNLLRETTPRTAKRLIGAMFGRAAPQHPGQAVMNSGRVSMGTADRGIHTHHTPVDPSLNIGFRLDRPQDTLPCVSADHLRCRL